MQDFLKALARIGGLDLGQVRVLARLHGHDPDEAERLARQMAHRGHLTLQRHRPPERRKPGCTPPRRPYR